MNRLAQKTAMRRVVHANMALSCTLGDDAVPLTARLHDKDQAGGDLDGQGYVTTIEGVPRVIFNREELAAANDGAGVVPARNDIVTFADYLGVGQNVQVQLDNRYPYDGPIEEKWSGVIL